MVKSICTENGNIIYELKSTKSSKIIVKIARDGRIICSCPSRMSISAVEDFIKSHAKWIIENSNKQKVEYMRVQNSELEQIFIFGKNYPIIKVQSDKVDVCFSNNVIYLYGDKAQSLKLLNAKIVQYAQLYLLDRVYLLKNQIGIAKDVNVEIKNVRSWWGCYCVKSKKIKLSLRLIAREKESIDAVIFHEFAHIKVQNHQKEFYNILLSYCPDYYRRKKALNNSKYAVTDKFILDK